MKFNMPLSTEDSISQKKLLEELFTAQEDGCSAIDTKGVHLSMQIFEKTFAAEICPNCKEGVIQTNHLGYYNIIIKTCKNCFYHAGISRNKD